MGPLTALVNLVFFGGPVAQSILTGGPLHIQENNFMILLAMSGVTAMFENSLRQAGIKTFFKDIPAKTTFGKIVQQQIPKGAPRAPLHCRRVFAN